MIKFKKFSLCINKINIVILLLITLSLVFLSFFSSQEINSKKSLSKELIATNSVQLQLKRFKVFSKKFLIAYNENESVVYAVKRKEGGIHKVSLDPKHKNPLIEEFIKLPKINSRDSLFVLDMSFDNNDIYVSFVGENSKIDECNYFYLYAYNLRKENWKQLFKSTPCIPKLPFHDIGGKISFNANSIFVSGGNIFTIHKNEEFIKNYKDLMEKTNIYGSVVEIDKKSLKSKKISNGHRSPGGLFWDSSRNILWEAEHGPRGGDELNFIKNNQDYGWPNVTYGEKYHKKNKSDFNTTYNNHEGYKKPFHTWVPSIGVSQIGIIVGNGEFSNYWDNSLIVASLKDRSLYRLRIEENRLIYLERIYIGERLRSLIITPNLILSSSDKGNLLVIKVSKDELPGGPFPSLKINPYKD